MLYAAAPLKCVLNFAGDETVNVKELIISEGLAEVRRGGAKPSE